MKEDVLRARIKLFRELFVSRDDAYVSWPSGSPVAVRDQLSDAVLKDHLRGVQRVGTYFLKSGERMTRKFAFDVDNKSRRLVKRIVRRLREAGAYPYVERSKNKGFHIWLFFDKPILARRARMFGRIILHGLKATKVELFPKQDQCTDLGFGLALPLFKPDVEKNRTVFVDSGFDTVPDQFAYLKNFRRTPREIVKRLTRGSATGTAREGEAVPFNVSSDEFNSKISEGHRNTILTRLAGAMRHQGVSKDSILVALQLENQKRCVPPLDDKELAAIASSISRYKPDSTGVFKGPAQELMKLVTDAELFHTPEGEPYAAIQIAGHREVWRLRDSAFRKWLGAAYYKKFKRPPSSQALIEALDTLAGLALHDGPERSVFARIAELNDALYLDLGDPTWRAVKIKDSRWRVVRTPRVFFRRTPGMQPLPKPVRGGSIDELETFLNLKSRNDFVLVVSWLLFAFSPRGPYPVLLLQGEAGSAKSTTSRFLRDLIDPNTCPLRSEPHTIRDLMIAAKNAHCLVFDNLSSLPGWLSDAFCRLATGGGLSVRKNYTDDEEQLFSVTCPILLTGISGTVHRGDLIDRCVIVTLPPIANKNRKPEEELRKQFKAAQPRILGTLLDGVATARARLRRVELDELSRMADFEKWSIAAERRLGWAAGTFISSYKRNLRDKNQIALDASLIVPALQKLCSGKQAVEETFNRLLERLKSIAGDQSKGKYWPKTAWALSRELRKIAPNLRAIGWEIDFDLKTPGDNSKRKIRLKVPLSKKSKMISELLDEWKRNNSN